MQLELQQLGAEGHRLAHHEQLCVPGRDGR
jgi:hypothetical protein